MYFKTTLFFLKEQKRIFVARFIQVSEILVTFCLRKKKLRKRPNVVVTSSWHEIGQLYFSKVLKVGLLLFFFLKKKLEGPPSNQNDVPLSLGSSDQRSVDLDCCKTFMVVCRFFPPYLHINDKLTFKKIKI